MISYTDMEKKLFALLARYESSNYMTFPHKQSLFCSRLDPARDKKKSLQRRYFRWFCGI